MKRTIKASYAPPTSEVVEVKIGGIIAASEETEGNEGVKWSGSY